MVDPARLRRLVELLEDFTGRLGDLRDLTREEYRDDHALAGRYLVQASAQMCIDIANHVIASEGYRVPKDFRDAFTVLEEEGVVDASLAEHLRRLTGLRNRLVHLYASVDDTLVHAALADGVADLEAFARIASGLAKG